MYINLHLYHYSALKYLTHLVWIWTTSREGNVAYNLERRPLDKSTLWEIQQRKSCNNSPYSLLCCDDGKRIILTASHCLTSCSGSRRAFSKRRHRPNNVIFILSLRTWSSLRSIGTRKPFCLNLTIWSFGSSITFGAISNVPAIIVFSERCPT